jgi:hypothetical protein
LSATALPFEVADEREDADVQHHHREQELDQPEAALLTGTQLHTSHIGSRGRRLKRPDPPADTE